MNKRVEKETEMFEQISHEKLNQAYGDCCDYGVDIDV